MLLADLDQVDGPREPRLVGVRGVATADEHAPRCIEPALGVVVHVLASHARSLRPERHRGSGETVQIASDTLRRHEPTLAHHRVR